MSDEQPTLDPFTLERFELTIENRIAPGLQLETFAPRDVVLSTFEATIHVDSETYERLADSAPLYTIQIDQDLNPWHREVSGWRAWLRRLRQGISWTFRRRILRLSLVEHVSCTIPNCRIAQGKPTPPHPTTEGESNQ